MIKAIIFDLGGVILLHKPMKMADFISQIFSIPVSEAEDFYLRHRRDLQIGKLNSKALLEKGKMLFNSSKTVEVMYLEWKNLYIKEVIGINYELLQLINKLKQKIMIYLFTNTIDAHAEYFNSLNLSDYFIKIFKSFEVGLIKPENDTYKFLLKQLKIKTNEIVFIDDLEENVDGAAKTGMNGIVYKSFSQLQADLRTLGVKI